MKERKDIRDITEAVFVIDMNVGFCEEGNLADPTIKHIVPNIIPIIRAVLEKGEGLFIVNDKHTKDSTELKRYAGHCDNEKESRTIKELAIYEEYAKIKKRNPRFITRKDVEFVQKIYLCGRYARSS